MTLGAEGMLLAENGVINKVIPTLRKRSLMFLERETLLSSLTLGLIEKLFAEAAEFANLAAGVVVGKVGTATVSPEEILGLVN